MDLSISLSIFIWLYWSSVIRYINIYNHDIFLISCFAIMKCPSLYLLIYLNWKSIFLASNIATSIFSYLLLAWYIFLNSFTVNLFVPMYLKNISYRQHIIGFCFSIQSCPLEYLINLYLVQLLKYLTLGLPFCYLFSLSHFIYFVCFFLSPSFFVLNNF